MGAFNTSPCSDFRAGVSALDFEGLAAGMLVTLLDELSFLEDEILTMLIFFFGDSGLSSSPRPLSFLEGRLRASSESLSAAERAGEALELDLAFTLMDVMVVVG